MIEHRGIYLPDGETHLVEMLDAGEMIGGRGTYQHQKFKASATMVPKAKRIVALDIGAHVGLWTIRLMPLFERVVCFEPVAAYRECFLRNTDPKLNPGAKAEVELHQVALGAEPGHVFMTRDPDNSGHTYVSPDGVGTVADVARLDDFRLDDVGFVKIDCEGFERFVVEGGKETLLRNRPVVIVEQKPEQGPRYGLEETDAVRYLEGLGARVEWTAGGDYCLRWR